MPAPAQPKGIPELAVALARVADVLEHVLMKAKFINRLLMPLEMMKAIIIQAAPTK